MAKQPWKVELTIEADEAFGLVLRKLHEMPGITDIRPILGGTGGTGAGAKRLEEAANEAQAKAKANSLTLSEVIVRYLMQQNAPARTTDLIAAIGRRKNSVASALHTLKKNGIIKSAGVGLYEMAVRPRDGETVPTPLALPAPAHTPTGRIVPGAGEALLLVILQHYAAPVPVRTLREQMVSRGVTAKSLSGISARAVRDKLVKRTGAGNRTIYELTAKGQQTAQATVAHGN